MSALAGQCTSTKGRHTNIYITLIKVHKSDNTDDNIVLIAALPMVIAVAMTQEAFTKFFIGLNLSFQMLGIILTALFVIRTAPFGFLKKS